MANELVRSESTWMQLQKFAERHKLLVVCLGTVFMLLLVTIVITSIMLQQAMHQRDQVLTSSAGLLPQASNTENHRPGDAVSKVLDALHAAASKADGKAYFDLFAPDAVFLGTDATERWTIEEFKTYAMKRFETGKGWTYTLNPGSRHISFSPDGSIAWFDELLENAKYGTCRGSGVLRSIDGAWKIAQYNLTLTVPNEAAESVVKIIRNQDAATSKPAD